MHCPIEKEIEMEIIWIEIEVIETKRVKERKK